MTLPAIEAPRLPRRAIDAHKRSGGGLLIIAGSVEYAGAVRLAAAGALAGGVGILTVVVPEAARALVCDLPAAVIVAAGMCTLSGAFAWTALPDLVGRAAAADAVVLGPGMGRHPDTAALVRRLVQDVAAPMVVDADALHAVAGARLGTCGGPRVWTPHAGEAARLLGVTVGGDEVARVDAARQLVAALGGVAVLKGPGTLVADATGVWQSRVGNALLATGGTGDVLAGLIGARLAAGDDALTAARAAVWLHGCAADTARATNGELANGVDRLLTSLARIVAAHEVS